MRMHGRRPPAVHVASAPAGHAYMDKYIINYMNSADKTLLLPLAFKSLKEVDLRRNQSFIDVFPEYQELAKEYGY